MNFNAEYILLAKGQELLAIQVRQARERIAWATDKLEKLAKLIEQDGPNPRYDAATVRNVIHALIGIPAEGLEAGNPNETKK